MLNWLLSKVRAARIVRGMQNEDGWITWHLVAGEDGQGGEIGSAQVLEWSSSLRHAVLQTFTVAAREMGYHIHPDDLVEFGAGLDLTRPYPRTAAVQHEPPSGEIANTDLTERDIPAPDAPVEAIHRFAVTFDGYAHYGSLNACAEAANRMARIYADHGTLPQSLTELRTALFFEQRRRHHFNYDPDEAAVAYLRALMEAIRAKVCVGAID